MVLTIFSKEYKRNQILSVYKLKMPNDKMMEIEVEKQELVEKEELMQKIDKKKQKFCDNNFLEKEKLDEYILKEGPNELRKFIIEKNIGKGAESMAYMIRLKNTNKCFALKIIKKRNNKSNFHELSILRKVKSKYIVNVLCYYADPKKEYDYVIMELAHSNLSHFTRHTLKRPTLSETFLCLIANQVLQGLHYLHRNKIAHLDLKPQNILITEYLDIKLIDFSVSVEYGKLNSEEIKLPYVGTPFFMPPEIIKRMKIKIRDLQKVDLFSLGVTLYVLAFGQYPFNIKQEDEDGEILKKMSSGWKVENENNFFSSELIGFLNSLLEFDINKRPTINQALNDYWVRGAGIILNEKENTANANIFLSYLITDHFRDFNQYISKNF